MGEKSPAIPIGIQDFREIRNDGYYYVDKSELIADIVSKRAKAYLFTRPRRFGKSLNLSMIDCFFNLQYEGNRWFDGLRIMEHRDAVALMNRYPVIRLDMKDLPVDDYTLFMDKFSVRLAELIKRFVYLRSSDRLIDEDRDFVSRAISRRLSSGEMQDSVRILCSLLTEYHGVRPVVLIDEYDNPINNAYDRDTYDAVLGFLRLFYSGILKGNDDLGFAVVTGVMQIASESIFSGLNSLEVNNILSEDSDERYGFTSGEVQGMCAYFGRPDAFAEAKDWYDGYRFGKADICNPWSVLKYVSSGFKPATYWAGTSGNDIIDTLIANADDDTYRTLQALGDGESIEGKDISATVVMSDLGRKKDALYSVMAMSGYLRVESTRYGCTISIPNREMYGVFADIIVTDAIGGSAQQFRSFFDAAEAGDLDQMERSAFSIFADHFEDWDLPDEGAYRRVLAGAAMSCRGRYTVTSEAQSGNGRSDMIMARNTPSVPNIVIEFKKTKVDDPAVQLKDAKEGLNQIKSREYYHSLRGRTILYGVAFLDKKAKVVMEEVDLRAPGASFRCGYGHGDRLVLRYDGIDDAEHLPSVSRGPDPVGRDAAVQDMRRRTVLLIGIVQRMSELFDARPVALLQDGIHDRIEHHITRSHIGRDIRLRQDQILGHSLDELVHTADLAHAFEEWVVRGDGCPVGRSGPEDMVGVMQSTYPVEDRATVRRGVRSHDGLMERHTVSSRIRVPHDNEVHVSHLTFHLAYRSLWAR